MIITVQENLINWTFQVLQPFRLNLINCYQPNDPKKWLWRCGGIVPKPCIPQSVKDTAVREFARRVTVG